MTDSTAPLATVAIEDPRTPAEAKRHWMIDRLWTMALFSFVSLLFLVGIVWLGRWPETLASARLGWLGWIAIGLLLQHLAIGIYFALGGPVGRWEARWKDASFRAEDDDAAARHAYDGGVT